MAKFIFNRIHLDSGTKIDNKVQFLLDGLVSKSTTSFLKHAYKLVDVQLKDDYIYGYLIKYDPYSENEVFDEETETVLNGGVANKIVAKSYFLINHKESLLINQIVAGEISKTTFKRRFRELFAANQKEKLGGSMDISEIVEQYTFLEKVKDLPQIKKITLNLVPSNPRFAERWEDIDKRLRENNIDRYREVQESKDQGSIKLDQITEDKILMSEDGYGTAKVIGVDDKGRDVTVTTKSKDRVVSAMVSGKVIEQGFLAIVNTITKTIKSIKDRTDNE